MPSSWDVLNGVHGGSFVEPDPFVKLIGQASFEVMTGQLGFRPIDHADGTLKRRVANSSRSAFDFGDTQWQEEFLVIRFVK